MNYPITPRSPIVTELLIRTHALITADEKYRDWAYDDHYGTSPEAYAFISAGLRANLSPDQIFELSVQQHGNN